METAGMTGQNSPWMDIEQAAQYIGLHPGTLRRKAQDGEIKYTRLTDYEKSQMRFHRDWLDAWLESRATGGQS